MELQHKHEYSLTIPNFLPKGNNHAKKLHTAYLIQSLRYIEDIAGITEEIPQRNNIE